MAAATAHVPATMRSGTVRWVTGASPSTPVTTKVDVPVPSMVAPIDASMRQMSTISGSRAALSMTVTPSAVTAAISNVSVAPRWGSQSQIDAPFSCSGAEARR